MKRIYLLIACMVFTVANAQFTGTDSLRNYNNKYITNNAATAFTNLRLNTLLRGMIDWIDTARAGTGGGGAIGIDTLWALNDSTVRYRKNGVFRNMIVKGVYDSRRKVDTMYKVNDTTIGFKINGQARTLIFPSGASQNISNTALTANGDYQQDWAQHWFFLNNLKALDINSNRADPNHPNNIKVFRFYSDSTADATALQLAWGLKDVNNSSTDSVHGELSSQLSTTSLFHWGNGGGRYAELDLRGNVIDPTIDFLVANASKTSSMSLGSTTYISPNDSLQIKAIPATTAPKILGFRAISGNVGTVVAMDAPTGSSDTLGLQDTLGIRDRYLNMQSHDLFIDSAGAFAVQGGYPGSGTNSFLTVANTLTLHAYDSGFVHHHGMTVFPDYIAFGAGASNVPPKLWVQASDSLYTNSPDAVWVTKNDTMKVVPIDSFAAIIGGGGEANTASNQGTGEGLFKTKSGVDLQFKSLTSDATIAITGNTNDVNIKGDTSVLATQFSTRKEQFLDSIYNKVGFSSISEFIDNSSGYSLSGGNIVFASGAGNFSKTLDLQSDAISTDHYTLLNHWKITAGFIITGGSTCGGVGLNSYNSFFPHSTLAQINTSNNHLVIWVDGSVVYDQASAFSWSSNDSVEVTYERSGKDFIASVRNVTTNSATTFVPIMLGFGGSSLPNAGRFSIFNIGGGFKVYKFQVTSTEPKNVDVLVLGDSKFAGYNATYAEYSVAYLLQRNYTVSIEAGPADYTQSFINVIPEVIARKPRQVLFCGGVNDVSFGISSSTWHPNIDTIKVRIERAGIRFVFVNSLYDVTSAPTVAAYINSTYPSNQVIDCFSAGNRNGTLAGDNVHPTDLGHTIAYETIINSGKLLYGHYSHRDTLFYNTRTTKNIYTGGATAPSTISDGDIILPYNVGLTAWAGATNRYGKILPFSNTGVVELRNYYYGTAGDMSHAWYIPNGSTGTQQLGYYLTNVGDAFNLGNIRLATTLVPTGFSSAVGHLILPVDGMIGAATGSANQRGSYMPFSNQGVSEYRNYFYSSNTHKSHAWYTPNGSTNTQQASLYITDDAKVHIPVKDSVSTPANMASINPATGAIEVAAVPTGSSDLTGGAVKANIHIVSDADYTIASTDYAIVYSTMTADRTLTLPSASGNTNRVLIIKQGGIATRVINLSIAIRENASVTTSMLGNGESVTIISDGTDWWIVQHGT